MTLHFPKGSPNLGHTFECTAYQFLTLSAQYLTLSNLIGFRQFPILTVSNINGFFPI